MKPINHKIIKRMTKKSVFVYDLRKESRVVGRVRTADAGARSRRPKNMTQIFRAVVDNLVW